MGATALTQWGVNPWLIIPFAMAVGFGLGTDLEIVPSRLAEARFEPAISCPAPDVIGVG